MAFSKLVETWKGGDFNALLRTQKDILDKAEDSGDGAAMRNAADTFMQNMKLVQETVKKA